MQTIMNPKFLRTTSENADFRQMVRELDIDLYQRNGETQAQYEPYNQIDKIKHCMVIYLDGKPVGCGCFKQYDEECIEMKRMFIKPGLRGKQLAARLLQELEKWAVEEGFSNAVLETGVRQVEAQRLYAVAGYVRIENYGQYLGMPDSMCYRKTLKSFMERVT
jgi:GNAT superfamily N-acetyltransferase